MNHLTDKIIELWQISRTALAGMQTVPSRYDRMIYVKRALVEYHSDLLINIGTGKHLWFAIEDAIA